MDRGPRDAESHADSRSPRAWPLALGAQPPSGTGFVSETAPLSSLPPLWHTYRGLERGVSTARGELDQGEKSPQPTRRPASGAGRSIVQATPSVATVDPRLATATREQTSHPCALDRATAESANQPAANDRRYPARGGSPLPWSVPPKQEPPLCTGRRYRKELRPRRDPPDALLAWEVRKPITRPPMKGYNL